MIRNKLLKAGWRLSTTGWQKKGWCFVLAWEALAVEEAFAGSRSGYFPWRTLATGIQVAQARQAIQAAGELRESQKARLQESQKRRRSAEMA